MSDSGWLLDVPAQQAYADGAEEQPTVREWEFFGFDIQYNPATGRVEIRSGGGGFDWQESVRVATTAALPANTRTSNTLTADANGALTIDGGIAMAVGDRVLVKSEALDAHNGLYAVDAIGDGSNPWQMTRIKTADEDGEITPGLTVNVEEGALNATTYWRCSNTGTIEINTTPITFELALDPGATGGGGTDVLFVQSFT